jgi:hypothetical protein
MRKRVRVRVRHNDELLPTAERLAHGEVIRLAAAIVDAGFFIARSGGGRHGENG